MRISDKYISNFKKFIDGSFLRKTVSSQWMFFIYLEILSVLYIANQFSYEKIYMDMDFRRHEILELKSESVSIATKLMELSKESQVAKEAEARKLDLLISERPPQQIIMPKETK
jgi:hypothetical protein